MNINLFGLASVSLTQNGTLRIHNGSPDRDLQITYCFFILLMLRFHHHSSNGLNSMDFYGTMHLLFRHGITRNLMPQPEAYLIPK